MTLRQTTALGLRLLGIYYLANILIDLPQLITYTLIGLHNVDYELVTDFQVLLMALAPHFMELSLSLLLIMGCRSLAHWAIPEPDPEDSTPTVPTDNLVRSGLIVAGCVIVVVNAADLLGTLIKWNNLEKFSTWLAEPQPVDVKAAALSQTFKVVVGVLMVRHTDWLIGVVRDLGRAPIKEA